VQADEPDPSQLPQDLPAASDLVDRDKGTKQAMDHARRHPDGHFRAACAEYSPMAPFRLSALLCAVAGCLAPAAMASPADYVFVPYGDAGIRRIAYDGGFERERDGGRELAHALSLGWNPTGRWFTALYASSYAEPGESLVFASWSWLNHVRLKTDGGPLEFGVLCDIARPHERDEGTVVTLGPTLQIDTERLQINFNPLLQTHVAAQDAEPTSLTYQWQVKRLWRPGVELGAQGFGDVGAWNHWRPAAQQEHRAGPAFFSKWTLSDGRVLKFDGAWLLGIGAGSPPRSLRVRLQQEF
jgi:hypothetical protein